MASERGLQTHMAAKQYRKIEGPAPGVEGLCAHDPPWCFCVGFPKSESIKIIPNIHKVWVIIQMFWSLGASQPLPAAPQDRMSLYIMCMRPIEFILCCLFCVLFFCLPIFYLPLQNFLFEMMISSFPFRIQIPISVVSLMLRIFQ